MDVPARGDLEALMPQTALDLLGVHAELAQFSGMTSKEVLAISIFFSHNVIDENELMSSGGEQPARLGISFLMRNFITWQT